MKKLLLLLVVAMASMSLAVAAPVDCAAYASPTANVLGLNPDGCTLGGLLFSTFAVSPGAQINLTNTAAPPASPTVDLTFSLITPTTGPFDTILTYTVTGGIFGIDAKIGTSSGPVQIIEAAFSSPGSVGPLGDLVATLGVPAADFFPMTSPVYISKDIKVGEGGAISDFTNSQHTPEPMSFVLMGTGLLGLGLIRRIRK